MTNKKSIETQIKNLETDCSHLMEQISLVELDHDKKQSEIDELKLKLTNYVSEYDNFVGTYWKINSTGHYFKILNIKH